MTAPLVTSGQHRPWRGRSFLAFAQRVLGSTRLPWYLGGVGLLLALPSLGAGWMADDHAHRVRLTGQSRFADLFGTGSDIFCFFDGDPERTRRLMDAGSAPWWTNPELHGAFWRPLSVATHRLDYHFWPTRPLLMHLQSALWYAALASLVTVLFRRLLGETWVAGLAALLYAIDDAHGMPVGFLANRNAILATATGVACLLAHVRWRSEGRASSAIVATCCFAASLLCGELGISTVAYLFAYAVILDPRSRRSRVVSLLPYVVVLACWRVAWDAMGYGISGTDLYVDPLRNPIRYAWSVLTYAPILVLGQFALPPSDADLMLGPAGSSRLWIVAVVIVAGIGILFSGMLRRDRLCRFWAVGSMLCLLPICATFPLDRLLFFVGIGAMGLLARFIADSTGGPGGEGRGRKGNGLRRLAVFFVVGVHLVVAPLVFPLRAAFPGGPPDFVRQVELRTPLDASVEVQDLIVINAPSPIHVCYSLAIREAAGLPLPRRMRVLAPAFPTIAVTREDERTLVIRPAKGFLPWKFDRLFRPRERPMRVGQHVSLTGLDIEVSAVLKDGTPTEAVFRFSVPLEDPSLRWLYWREGEFVAFTPPLVGERIELRGQLPTGL